MPKGEYAMPMMPAAKPAGKKGKGAKKSAKKGNPFAKAAKKAI